MGKRGNAHRKRVEFVGGPKDGEWDDFKDPVPDRYEVAKHLAVPTLVYEDGIPPRESNEIVGVYVLTIWSYASKEEVFMWLGEVYR